MKKIGIILDSLSCSKFLHETVSDLSKNPNIELYFLLNIGRDISAFQRVLEYFKRNKFFRIIELIYFRLISIFEYKTLSFLDKNLINLKLFFNIDGLSTNQNVLINPIFSPSGLVVRYSKEDINRIKSLDLDMIVRGNARGIFRGDILNCTKKGIISFHHGDNRWNRGGPAGFWEVFLKKSSTGFIIQFLKSKLDGGSVIFRGNIATKGSFIENQHNLYEISNPFMAKIINEYANNDYLPEEEEKFDFNEPILKVPSLIKSFKYNFYISKYLFIQILKFFYRKTALAKYVINKRNQWGVAFIKSNWENSNLSDGVKVKNPKNHYFADPFVIKKNNRTICFVEDYDMIENKGHISAIEIFKDKKYKLLGPVIKESFHMSYPFIFEHNNDLFMTPETVDAKSIRLYRCKNFPLEWEFEKEIVTNQKAIDPSIFKYEDQWWLFYNILTGKDTSSILMAYYSENPISQNWSPHKLNPIVFDSNIGRNGGFLQSKNSSIRVRQKQGFNFYGKSFTLAKIKDLTSSTFKEQQIKEILPNFFNNISACHHMHSNGEYTVYDYFFNSKF
tara:strand:+ start:1406 stop:3088 length:1683 start_codon:yes stop_codon:yes gene_type:complete